MTYPIILTNFEPVVLTPHVAQNELTKVFTKAMAVVQCIKRQAASQAEANAILLQVNKNMQRYSVGNHYITQRQVNIFPPKYFEQPVAKRPLVSLIHDDVQTEFKGNPINQRMELYETIVQDACDKWYAQNPTIPHEIIHVTCSGYSSPNPVQRMVGKKRWAVLVNNCYNNDCYGAFPAVRMAQGSLAVQALSSASASAKPVDIVHTEVLSLHVDVSEANAENMVKATLFGDGFIKYSAVSAQNNCSGLKVIAIHESIIPDSADQMRWRVAPHHFEMHLSVYVPRYIGVSIVQFVEELCAKAHINFATEKDKLYFAIHPGGPKILDFIQEKLGLRNEQLRVSWDILAQHGNMSSATIPHIWQHLHQDANVPVGSLILSLAFGPGLSACGMLMEKC
jgi:predicted naringenin-chalcone synthase